MIDFANSQVHDAHVQLQLSRQSLLVPGISNRKGNDGDDSGLELIQKAIAKTLTLSIVIGHGITKLLLCSFGNNDFHRVRSFATTSETSCVAISPRS